MATDPANILNVADTLRVASLGMDASARREAIVRSAISRYYYAAYSRARQHAKSAAYLPGVFREDECPDERLGLHQTLWLWWYVDQEPEDKLSGAGNSLHGIRKFCDYDIDQDLRPNQVENARILCNEVFKIVAQLEEVPPIETRS